jgi:hypothetical protein
MARSSPVILIVEDEFLLRMDSAEVIENAGFEVHRGPHGQNRYSRRLHRYPDAGHDGRPKACPVRA